MLQELISRFSQVQELPVEVPDVRDALLSLGVQDEIILCPDDSLDVTILRGTYYQFTTRRNVYGDPSFCSLIVYASKLPVEWQRLIACKEMMHIIDSKAERTSTLEELDGMVNRLLGPLSSEDFDLFDIVAAKDRLALYHALPILFPDAAREAAVRRVEEEGRAYEEIAKQACLPLGFVRLVLRPEWPALQRELCC